MQARNVVTDAGTDLFRAYIARGFTWGFSAFCVSNDLDPSSVGSVARYNCDLREGEQ